MKYNKIGQCAHCGEVLTMDHKCVIPPSEMKSPYPTIGQDTLENSSKCKKCGLTFGNDDMYKGMCEQCLIAKLLNENDEMKKALRFYADTKNYHPRTIYEGLVLIKEDEGYKAREALKKNKY